jgi:prepilin-type N-terminal cleavage/methylation domain-containing protein/prepilin-type processing-associated H-X9-DG protein
MFARRRSGFTLIELLVVIAIIAILAAMLFPVFARARESARKIQCLSSIKNIAMAVQMYLADYDRLMPSEHRSEVVDMFGCTEAATLANPYLKAPVVLDEYVRNRDVWRCPSARVVGGAGLINPGPDWFAVMLANEPAWRGDDALCTFNGWFPPGWGGSVTDTFLQGPAYTPAQGATDTVGRFEQSITVNLDALLALGLGRSNYERKLSSVNDPASFVFCGDGGWKSNTDYMNIALAAYPEICCLWCSAPNCGETPNWENCPDAAACGIYAPSDGSLLKDVNLRKRYARHLGGVNVGFLDGHAQWFSSEGLIAKWAELARGGDTWPMGLIYEGPASFPTPDGFMCDCSPPQPALF